MQNSNEKRRACVFGASGHIGTNLVPRLVAQGYKVRAVARNLAVLEAREWKQVELRQGDALKPETLGQALEGMDLVYYLVHSMAAGKNFGQLEAQAADNFGQAASAANVKHIIYLSSLIPEDAESEHFASRRETGARLRRHAVPVTEIRAGIVVGPGSAAFEVIRDLVNHLPVLLTPRWVSSKSPPIALDNLLEYLIRIPEVEIPAGGLYEVAGPEVLSYKELMTQYGEIVGKRPRIIRIPLLTPRLSSYFLRLVTTVPTNVARALIAGLKHDMVADDAPLRALIPQTLLTFREAVEATLQVERQQAQAARWVEGVLIFRGCNPQYAFYAKKASGAARTRAKAEAVWREVAAIGGANRYYHLDILWTLREMMDWAIGGPGLNRGRRHPTEVRVGDMIDSWRVIGVDPQRHLTLAFGMKAPGAGVLEFDIATEDGGLTRITATAYWHSAGIWGLLYWYSVVPLHDLIFKGMTAAIAKRAEKWERQQANDVQWSERPSTDGESSGQQ